MGVGSELACVGSDLASVCMGMGSSWVGTESLGVLQGWVSEGLLQGWVSEGLLVGTESEGMMVMSWGSACVGGVIAGVGAVVSSVWGSSCVCGCGIALLSGLDRAATLGSRVLVNVLWCDEGVAWCCVVGVGMLAWLWSLGVGS